MTFKHVKFEDSVVMRSLEKLAKEKGWVQPEKITKTASSKTDLSPSANLMENVINLCSGLRQSGFHKHAEELEEKFMCYKQAQTLYETSSEKGEDLVECAHAGGSHKLEDVEGGELAVFETIIDQHAKHLQMIDKKPTGKLASSRDILGAVKIALGQDNPDLQQVISFAEEVSKIVEHINNTVKDELTFSISAYVDTFTALKQTPTVYNLNKMKDSLARLYDRLNPSLSSKWSQFGIGGVSKYTWNGLQGFFSKANTLVDNAITLRTKIDAVETAMMVRSNPETKTETKTETKPGADPLLDKIKAAKRALAGIGALVEADRDADKSDVAEVTDWIKDIDARLKNLESTYKEIGPADVEAALNNLTKDFQTVRQEWV